MAQGTTSELTITLPDNCGGITADQRRRQQVTITCHNGEIWIRAKDHGQDLADEVLAVFELYDGHFRVLAYGESVPMSRVDGRRDSDAPVCVDFEPLRTKPKRRRKGQILGEDIPTVPERPTFKPRSVAGNSGGAVSCRAYDKLYQLMLAEFGASWQEAYEAALAAGTDMIDLSMQSVPLRDWKTHAKQRLSSVRKSLRMLLAGWQLKATNREAADS